MNAKKYVVAAILLNVVLLAFASSFWRTKRGANDPATKALTGLSGKFGPTINTVVPAAKTNGATDILDLEAGRAAVQPPFEYFNFRADAIMAWIRSNRLDISSSVWSASAACVTHDMAIVAVDGKRWEETTEEELLNNPALATGCHHPRRLLLLGQNHPNTYMFRTGEGTLGMLQLTGLSQRGQGVRIRYKLINPAKSPSVASSISKL